MWWAGSERVPVYVGAGCAGVVLPGLDTASAHWVTAGSAGAALEQALIALAEASPIRRRNKVLEVQLSGALARPFIFEPIEGLKSWTEALEVAATLAPEATGLPGPCVVWLDDWMPGHRCVAVAVDAGLRDQIERIVREAKGRIAALRPWWAAAIDGAARLDGVLQILSIEDTDSITVLTASDGGGYSAVASYVPKPSVIQARALVSRAAMASNAQSDRIARATLGSSSVQVEHQPGAEPPSLVPRVERGA